MNTLSSLLNFIGGKIKGYDYPKTITGNTPNKSVANSTTTPLGSIDVPAGAWLVNVKTLFDTNTTGRRIISVGANQNSLNPHRLTINPVSGGQTALELTCMLVVTEEEAPMTFYLNAYQNSGGSLNCTSNLLRVLKIGESYGE